MNSVKFKWQKNQIESLSRTVELDECCTIINTYCLEKNISILEFGCGLGRWLKYYHDQGFNITGIEFDELALKTIKNTWRDLKIVRGDCSKTCFSDNTFDLILAFGVIEHWPNGPSTPLREMHRILKPGGKCFITVPLLNKIRLIKKALFIDKIQYLPIYLLKTILNYKNFNIGKKISKPLKKDTAVYPPFGPFFEYRFTKNQFYNEVEKVFEIQQQFPVAHMDGVFHELNMLNLLVKFENCTFRATSIAKKINKKLKKYPFFHSHMQAIIAYKR